MRPYHLGQSEKAKEEIDWYKQAISISVLCMCGVLFLFYRGDCALKWNISPQSTVFLAPSVREHRGPLSPLLITAYSIVKLKSDVVFMENNLAVSIKLLTDQCTSYYETLFLSYVEPRVLIAFLSSGSVSSSSLFSEGS